MVDTENVIIVSGAGSSEVNGVYIYAGQSYEKPAYTHKYNTEISLLWFMNNAWSIQGEEIYYYYSNENVASPELVETWSINVNGDSPAPRVKKEIASKFHKRLLKYNQNRYEQPQVPT